MLPTRRYDHQIFDIIQLEAEDHHLLCATFQHNYPCRLVRRNDERMFRQTPSMITTRIKLVTNEGVEKTRKFSKEWSRRHFNRNFFSINSVSGMLPIKYPEPWCAEFQWEDDPMCTRDFPIGLQFHIASIQTADWKNYSLDHPLMHMIIEFHMHDNENPNKMQLVDCYSCDILIFYFESSKFRDLLRAFDEGFVKKAYTFSKCQILDTTFHQPCQDKNFKILDENLYMHPEWIEIIQIITNNDEYERHSIDNRFSNERPQHGEKGKCRSPFLVKGPNFLMTHFSLTLVGGRVSQTVNNGQDWGVISSEPFEISIECQHIAYREILNFNFSMTVNNPLYDHLDIEQAIHEYANSTEDQESKFLRFLPECAKDNMLDYQQWRSRPQSCQVKYLPEISEKFKLTFQIPLSDGDLIELLQDGLITEKKPVKKPKLCRIVTKRKRVQQYILKEAEGAAEDDISLEMDKTPDPPLKIRLKVEISSAHYGTIYESHYKDIMVFSPVDYRRNILYEQTITPNLNFEDQKCIFRRNEKAKHFISQDGFVIPLHDKSTIDNFFGPDKNFYLSLDPKYFHCKRENPNDSDSYIVTHYPNFHKIMTHPSNQNLDPNRFDRAQRIENRHHRLGLVQHSVNNKAKREHRKKLHARATSATKNSTALATAHPTSSNAFSNSGNDENPGPVLNNAIENPTALAIAHPTSSNSFSNSGNDENPGPVLNNAIENPTALATAHPTSSNSFSNSGNDENPGPVLNNALEITKEIDNTTVTNEIDNITVTNEIIVVNGPAVATGTVATKSIPMIPSETVPCNSTIIAKKTVAIDLTGTSVQHGTTIIKGLKSPNRAFPLIRERMNEDSRIKEQNSKPNNQQIPNGNIGYDLIGNLDEHSESDEGRETTSTNDDSPT